MPLAAPYETKSRGKMVQPAGVLLAAGTYAIEGHNQKTQRGEKRRRKQPETTQGAVSSLRVASDSGAGSEQRHGRGRSDDACEYTCTHLTYTLLGFSKSGEDHGSTATSKRHGNRGSEAGEAGVQECSPAVMPSAIADLASTVWRLMDGSEKASAEGDSGVASAALQQAKRSDAEKEEGLLQAFNIQSHASFIIQVRG